MDDKPSSSRRSADHIHVEKQRRAIWPWVLGACGIGLLAVALFAQPKAPEHAAIPVPVANQAGGGGGHAGATIQYNGKSWVASGPRVPIPDAQMKQVGKSEKGLPLYGNTKPGAIGGGGGGGGSPVVHTAPMDRPYVRVSPNVYQPLAAAPAQTP